MTVQEWSDDIMLVELASEPQFSEDLATLNDRLAKRPHHVVVSLAEVGHLNSSNLAQLLRLRKRTQETDRQVVLTAVPDGVWGVMLVTGLDKVFRFAEDVPSALATLQLDGGEDAIGDAKGPRA